MKLFSEDATIFLPLKMPSKVAHNHSTAKNPYRFNTFSMLPILDTNLWHWVLECCSKTQ